MTAKYGNSAGFSLFELMVVMVIIGLGSAIVIPRFFGSFSSMEVNAAARKTASALKYARNLSVYSNTPYQVSLNTNERIVKVEKIVVEEGLPGVQNIRLESVQNIRLGEGILLQVDKFYKETPDNGIFQFLFFPSGASRTGSIVLSNSDGDVQHIIIDSVTGFAKLES